MTAQMPGTHPLAAASQAADALTAALGTAPDVAVVLGSGWAEAVSIIGDPVAEVAYADLPGFPPPSVEGHGGVVSLVPVGGRHVALLQGRIHLYEGHDPAVVVHPLRTAILAGCDTVIITNGCGGINPDYRVGQLVLIADHLNLTGRSPLWGPEAPDPFPIRFTDLTDAYSPRLRALARRVDPNLAEGVYCGLPGPHYETPAEIAMLATVGADLVGMSTVLETIAARHLGAEVLGLSLVTNPAAGIGGAALSHLEVVEAGHRARASVGETLRSVLVEIAGA